MPKQHMSIRNKQFRGPSNPRVASPKKRIHAKMRGRNAWELYGKSISDNPYKPGLEHDAWKEGYIQASKFKANPVIERAPEGMAPHKESTVVVKRTGNTRSLTANVVREPKDHEPYLGYIKPGKNGRPKRFYVWSRNPAEDEWRNKIACKSYKPEKDVESTILSHKSGE